MKKYPANLQHGHSIKEIQKRLNKKKQHNFLRDVIYGGVDGAVSTFAVVSSVVGGGLNNNYVLIIGFANIVADGFSMAASNYLGTKSEVDEYNFIENFEKEEIHRNKEGEQEEVVQILKNKGFDGDLLRDATDLFINDKKKWIELMLIEEYGLALRQRSPIKSGFVTFSSFCICGLIPITPFFLKTEYSFFTSAIMTCLSFFVIGSVKSKWNDEGYFYSGLKTFLVGLSASLFAFGIGLAAKLIIDPSFGG